MKQTLIDDICVFLLRNGYTAKYLRGSCFDVLARKDTTILLLKVLQDANSITHGAAEEMHKICSYITASPLIIADGAGEALSDHVIYSRFGIYTMNPATFKNSILQKHPFVKRSKAGLTAHIVGGKLREMREDEGISLKALAQRIGVSDRMVRRYEDEGADITIRKALKVYDLFGEHVFQKLDIFSKGQTAVHEATSEYSRKYEDLGFASLDTHHAPFDIIAKREKDIILTELGDTIRPEVPSMSKLIDADTLIIFKNKRPRGMPSLTKEEFLEFRSAKDLIKYVKERKE